MLTGIIVCSLIFLSLKGSTMKSVKMFALCAGAVLFVNVATAVAQNDAGAKIRGDAWGGAKVQTYQRHAQDGAQMLHYYSQSETPVSKPEVKELVGGIKKDLTAADKALAKLKADHAKEPDVVKQIALIEKHQARAHEVCGMAEEQCAKEHGDHVVICDCCADMWHELDAAQIETTKLLKMLKIEKLPIPKKADDKKTEKKSDK